MGNGELPIDEQVARVRETVITGRLRRVALSCLVVVTMLVVTSIVASDALPRSYTPLRLLGLLVILAFLAFSYRPAFARHQQWWGWLFLTGISMITGLAAVARNNAAIAAILEAMVVLLASAMIPWGGMMQTATAAACAVILAVVTWMLGPYQQGDPNVPVLIDAMTGIVISIFVAQSTRRSFDKATAENLRLAVAREEIRTLADQLEAKVRERTAELEATLADQREMTRAISHDLRQPLRHIAGFTRMLSDDLADSLNSEHRERMARVSSATARMDHMVDALLEISRVAGAPVERRPIDLSAMAREIGSALASQGSERTVEFTVENGLLAEGDAGLMRNLLHALLANAWKFTRGRDPAKVHVGKRGDAFVVTDNGSGFHMDHATKLFSTFERLHHFEEFEGEGVGLAIAERVVRRHGGRIWAESEPGQGATFLFTLSPSSA